MRFAAAFAAFLILMPLAAPAQENPESVYAKFHRSLHAGDIATMIRYGSEPGASEMRKDPGQAKGMLDLMKKLIPASYTLVGKEISPDGNRVTLRATGRAASLFGDKEETQYGTIRLVKQGGEWKVDESNWDNKPHARSTAAPRAAPATRETAKPASAPRMARSTDPAPERKLGTRKAPCVYKPVMTDEDIEACR